MDIHDWPYIKKSARRKKRLVKKDFDKQLRQLSKKRQELSDQISDLPPVILDKPYQKGWVRLFVLRDDIAQSDKAEFYQTLLDKVNNSKWHYDRSFKRRKIRKGIYEYYHAEKQVLREFHYDVFHGNKLNLSEAEKACFATKEIWNTQYRRWNTIYYIAEPWRFALVIKPHIVYKVRMVNELLERQLSVINDYIDRNKLLPRIWKLMGGNNNFWHRDYQEQLQYINELKNQPRYASTEAYLDY